MVAYKNPKLVIQSGPMVGEALLIDGPEVVIGRETGVTWVIDSPGVSRRHARLFFRQDLVILEDLNSSNGTFINGERLTQPLALKPGDQIGLGRMVVLVFLAEYCLALGEYRAGLAYAREAHSVGKRIGGTQIQATALTAQGAILTAMQQFAHATAAFQQAFGLRKRFILPITAVLPLAGLARVCLAQEDRAQALSHVEAILENVGTPSRLRHLWEPFPVYLIVYRVLHANGDRRAGEVLETAHRLLLAQAAKIGSEDLRRAYLENVAAHRELVALWERDSGPSGQAKRGGLRIA